MCDIFLQVYRFIGYGDTIEEAEDNKSSTTESSGSSESELASFCRYNVSPITSDEELSLSECDIGDEVAGETEPTEAQQPSSTQASLNSHLSARPITTYRLCGDNIDKGIRARYLRSDRGNPDSIHYFHTYAALDPVDFSTLSEYPLPLPQVSDEQIAISLLPSEPMCPHYNVLPEAVCC